MREEIACTVCESSSKGCCIVGKPLSGGYCGIHLEKAAQVLALFRSRVLNLKPLEVTTWAKWDGQDSPIITTEQATKCCQRAVEAQLARVQETLLEDLEGK